MTLQDRNPHAPIAWQGELPITNRYTYGLAGEKFFRALKEQGQILGTRCPRCQRTYVPAASFCERCFNELEEWIEIDPFGEVETYTILYVSESGSPLPTPMIIGFIRMEDGGLIHRVADIDAEEIYFGMPVEAVFKPPVDRQGSILDILYFKPV
jgi:hypothetical protein